MNSFAAISGLVKIVTGEHGDVSLLQGQFDDRVAGSFPHDFAGGFQLAPSSFRKAVGTHVGEHLECDSQRGTRIHSATLAPKPFPVHRCVRAR